MSDAKQHKGSNIGSALGALAAKECLALERALKLHKGCHDGIHEARKSSRRLRSLLGFLRSLSDQRTAALEKSLKQLVRGFSGLRDAHVAARTARLLVATHETVLTSSLLDALENRSKVLLKEALEKDPNWRRRYAKAHRITTVLGDLPWQQIDSVSINKMLMRSTRRTKKARKAALEERTISAHHRWRRRARQLRYELEFLRKVDYFANMKKKRAKRYEARIKHLNLIIDRLGWRQDFRVFMAALDQLPDSLDVAALREALRVKSATLSKTSPAMPKSKAHRAFIANGSSVSI